MTWITRSELMRYQTLGDLPEARIPAFAQGDEQETQGTWVLFLYSRLDEALAQAAGFFLKSHGVPCRIDALCVEPDPQGDPVEQGAIKRRIQRSHKVVILASNEAFRSGWLAWYLAYCESFKVKQNMAVFPVADDQHYWLGDAHRAEFTYLDFYPRIGKFIQGYWCVMDPNQAVEHVKMTYWLKKVASETLKVQPQL